MADETNTVTLGSGDGAEQYDVTAQPYPVLFRKLSAFGDELQQLGELDAADLGAIVVAVGGRVHEFLRIFIPNLMAEWRFQGLAGPGAEATEESEQAAPTIPQIREAVEAGFRANGLTDIGALLGKLLGPGMKGAVQQLMAAQVSEMLSRGSMNSPSPPDGSTSPDSTPTGPTVDVAVTPPGPSSIPERANVASPSPVSSL